MNLETLFPHPLHLHYLLSDRSWCADHECWLLNKLLLFKCFYNLFQDATYFNNQASRNRHRWGYFFYCHLYPWFKRNASVYFKELVLQGERLHNIDRNLDDINQDLKETKKNISNLRSFFSRIKNKFSRSTATTFNKEDNVKPLKSLSANQLAPIYTTASSSDCEHVKISGSDREAG